MREDRKNKTAIYITKNENYAKFKEKVKSKGLTIQGVLDNFIKKVANGKIKLLDVISDD